MSAIDLRIVRVSIEVDGQLKQYENVAITASGTKYANSLQNNAEITLYNLDKQTQNDILTQTSPYTLNRQIKTVILEAGRVSTGYTKIYQGNVIVSSITQPPDIGIVLKCLTGNFYKGNIITKSFGKNTTIEQISEAVAKDTQTQLDFHVSNEKNKSIANYQYSGAAIKQIESVAALGGINIFLDDNTLVVKDAAVPLTNVVTFLNQSTGMLGIPHLTEQGIKVKFFVDNTTKLGGTLRINSEIYPAINGDYVVYKLSFEISNRDTPFYYIAEAARRR